jgi:hypothetical protein
MNSYDCSKQPSFRACSNNSCTDVEVTLKEYSPPADDKLVYPKQCLRVPRLSMDDATSLHDGKQETITVIVNNEGIECISTWDPSGRTVSSNAAEETPTSIHESNTECNCFPACKSSDETEVCNNTSRSKKHANTSNTNKSPKRVDSNQPLMPTRSFDPFGVSTDFSVGEPPQKQIQISNMNEKSALDTIMNQEGISSPNGTFSSTSSSTSSFEYILRYCGFVFFDIHEVEDCCFDVE